MNILGIGIDIIEVKRIEQSIKKYKNFLNKFFSKDEIKYCFNYKNKYERLAARFSAKEALIKAISNKNISLKDIEVINELSGKPILKVRGLKNINFLLSISHTKEYACAVCIALENSKKILFKDKNNKAKL